MKLKKVIKEHKTSIGALLFILIASIAIYLFLGIRYEFSLFSKIIISLTTFIFYFFCYRKSISHLSLAMLTSISIFLSLSVSFGSIVPTASPFNLPIILGAWSMFFISIILTGIVMFLYEKMSHKEKYNILLFGVFVVFWIILAFNTKYYEDWKLENLLNITFVVLLLIFHKWFKFSKISYSCVFIFMVLNVIGSHYTYSEVPFGFWLQDVFNMSRNHYDRIVHFSFGLLFAYPMREIFKRIGNSKGFWAFWIPVELVLALSCVYELIEWGIAIVFGGDLGIAYLGSQGDIWDAQKDMALAGLGSVVAMCITAFFIMRYNMRGFWKEFKESLKIDKTVLGEEALAKLERKKR